MPLSGKALELEGIVNQIKGGTKEGDAGLYWNCLTCINDENFNNPEQKAQLIEVLTSVTSEGK